jgi:hypothetical protein
LSATEIFQYSRYFFEEAEAMPSPGHGGSRVGAGRPRKALTDKQLEGRGEKEQLKVVQFPGTQKLDTKLDKKSSSTKKASQNLNKSDVPAYLDLPSREGTLDIPQASEIFKLIADWVGCSSCSELVAPHLIEDFAILRRGYLECEAMNKKLGRILQNGKRSPYVQMSLEYERASRQIYYQIWQVLSANSQTAVGEANDFLSLLQNRGF